MPLHGCVHVPDGEDGFLKVLIKEILVQSSLLEELSYQNHKVVIYLVLVSVDSVVEHLLILVYTARFLKDKLSDDRYYKVPVGHLKARGIEGGKNVEVATGEDAQ